MRPTASLTLLIALSWLGVSLAQPPEDEYAATIARFASSGDLSTGCTLVELERRMGRLQQAESRARGLISDELARHLSATAEPTSATALAPPSTVSACHYNHGRVLVDLGRTADGIDAFEQALDAPTAARRPIVERALAEAYARLVGAGGTALDCGSIDGLVEAQALLRFADLPALRACARRFEQEAPVCEAVDRLELADTVASFADVRPVPDAPLRVGLDAGEFGVFRVQGASVRSGVLCRIGVDPGAFVQFARVVELGGGPKLLAVGTAANVSMACDCDEADEADEWGACRCEESTWTLHLFEPSGRLLLSVVDAENSVRPSIVATRWEGPTTYEPSALVRADPTRPGVLLIGGRPLVLRRGALVPAPAPRTARRP